MEEETPFYGIKPIAFGYEANYSVFQDLIVQKLDKLVEDGMMNESDKAFIMARLEYEKWTHPIGILYSKSCKGNPGETATDEEVIEKFRGEYGKYYHNGPTIGYSQSLFFSYSKKKEKLTYISTFIYINGHPYFAVLFSTDKGATSVIKKELMNKDPRHEEITFEKKLQVECKPYLYLSGKTGEWTTTTRCVHTMQEYRELKQAKTPKKKKEKAVM